MTRAPAGWWDAPGAMPMTSQEREALTAACREILRGHVTDPLLEDVAASCPSVEHAHRAVEELRQRYARHQRSRR